MCCKKKSEELCGTTQYQTVLLGIGIRKNQVQNFEKPITDSDSSTPQTFDQTL
jgi:hypothetical protein